MTEQDNAQMLNGPELEGMEEYRSLMDVFHGAVKRFADKPAFSCMGQTLTFNDLDRLSANFAAWLQNETRLQPGIASRSNCPMSCSSRWRCSVPCVPAWWW